MCIHDTTPQDLAYRGYQPNKHCAIAESCAGNKSGMIVSNAGASYLGKVQSVSNSSAVFEGECRRHLLSRGPEPRERAFLSEDQASCGETLYRVAQYQKRLCENALAIAHAPVIKPKGYLLQSLFLMQSMSNAHEPLSDSSQRSAVVFEPWRAQAFLPAILPDALLSLPLASAGAIPDQPITAEWDDKFRVFTVDDDAAKAEIFSVFKTFMIDEAIMNERQGEQFEFDWRNNVAGVSLYVWVASDKDISAPAALSRVKRINHNKHVAEHIKEHCAYEEEIFNAEGEHVGKQLIVQAQNVENPLRLIFGDTSKQEVSPLKKFAQKSLSVIFFVLTAGFTLGIAPVAQHIYASVLRRRYYLEQGDAICAERQKRLIVADLATALMVDTIPYRQRARPPHKNVQELMHSIEPVDRAALRIKDKHTNIEREVLIKVNDGASTSGGAVGETFIKSSKTGDGHTLRIESNNISPPEKKVIFDKHKNEWRYVDAAPDATIKTEVIDGKKFIPINGKKYEVHSPAPGQYKIIVGKSDGSVSDLLVYRESISKTWHLYRRNGRPVFTKNQKSVIERNKLTQEMYQGKVLHIKENMDAERYGSGKIFEVRHASDDVSTTPPLYTVAEMNGELVKIHTTQDLNKIKHYAASGSNAGKEKNFLLDWDGNRWVFECAVPPSVPKALSKKIKIGRAHV